MSPALRFTILERDGFRCRYCGATADDARLHIDHVLAKSRGGSDREENLVTACQECNLGKAARLLEEPIESHFERAYATLLYEWACEHLSFDAHEYFYDFLFWCTEAPDLNSLRQVIVGAPGWREAKEAADVLCGMPSAAEWEALH